MGERRTHDQSSLLDQIKTSRSGPGSVGGRKAETHGGLLGFPPAEVYLFGEL